MKIFILEDSNFRIKKFKKLYKEHDLVIKTNAKEACEYIYLSADFDLMFLDHDLGRRFFCGKNNPNTGYAFIKKMIKRIKDEGKTEIIVLHTWNPFGAYRMKKILKAHNMSHIWEPCKWPF